MEMGCNHFKHPVQFLVYLLNAVSSFFLPLIRDAELAMLAPACFLFCFKPCFSHLMFMKPFFFFFLKPKRGNLHLSLLPGFGPLFQPVKIFLSLDPAILSMNNPSGFVSTPNLISTSSVLLHPSR